MKNRPIGVLDSGVGGLTVVKELIRQLPNEDIIYVGDSARAPYGPRPAQQIFEYTWDLVNFLVEKNVKMIIIACNTATAVALDDIREKLDIPVLGVILPGSRSAIKTTKNNRIGVIGTNMTISSNSYKDAIDRQAPNMSVYGLACPKFVPLVESNDVNSPLTKKVVYDTLSPLVGKVDTLVLGCTHYPLLRPVIQNVMGQDVSLVDSGAETVSDVAVILNHYDLSAPHRDKNNHQFYTTAGMETFKEIAENWLEIQVEVEQIKL